jgi:predicted RNase H-like HicB family nuclease
MGNICVVYHQDGKSWWANSRQVSGFHVGGDSLGQVRERVRSGLPFFLEVSDIEYIEQTEDGNAVISASEQAVDVSHSASTD